MRSSRWAIFLSGRGSNAQALWENINDLNIALCVSSRKKSQGLLRAKRVGIPTLVLEPKVEWDELTKKLKARGINRIFLLGFMKILPASFCQAWQGRIWNLHPSLLPEFTGADAIERSYQAGGSFGVSIHAVTAEMDAGPLCLQSRISSKVQNDFPTLQGAQMRISITEQRLVREWAGRAQAQRRSVWI
ncbi:MAG: formyltransferase family protein [Pseudobdellovibrionaceae bacterium]